MAEIQPFRGWRYDVSQVGSLSDVTAPPYDVIDDEQQKAFYELHPCNVIRLILNRDESGDTDVDARYGRAASFLSQWQSEGVLQREREDALYVYHQEFDWAGVHYVRRGFLARLRLEEFGKGQVYPHEQTMSGPKADRLKLINACKTNLSPLFGIFSDPDQTAQAPLEEAVLGETAHEATDHLGVIHRLWVVTDPDTIRQVQDALSERPIFIADGHHRYETALNYRNQLAEAGQLQGETDPANFVMMMFVGMSDPGLAILPTHRVISGLPEMTAADLQAALGEHLELETLGSGEEAARQAWELMEADGGQDVFSFGTTDGVWQFGRLTDDSLMESLAPDQSDGWRQLGVSLLHRLILDHLIGQKYPDAELNCKYIRRFEEVVEAQTNKTAQLVCFVAPASMEHIQDIASTFEKMPPKSTFFYPKLLSGLVFNPLT